MHAKYTVMSAAGRNDRLAAYHRNQNEYGTEQNPCFLIIVTWSVGVTLNSDTIMAWAPLLVLMKLHTPTEQAGHMSGQSCCLQSQLSVMDITGSYQSCVMCVGFDRVFNAW